MVKNVLAWIGNAFLNLFGRTMAVCQETARGIICYGVLVFTKTRFIVEFITKIGGANVIKTVPKGMTGSPAVQTIIPCAKNINSCGCNQIF